MGPPWARDAGSIGPTVDIGKVTRIYDKIRTGEQNP